MDNTIRIITDSGCDISAVVGNENRSFVIADYLQEFFPGIFGRPRNEQVRAYLCVELQHLAQQGEYLIHIALLSASDGYWHCDFPLFLN